ncbi:MAG TPA: diguanylate cyclase [Cyanobacteria bacterium UBA9273]|nr:diguanylate cyclase [Cyanobacteria bacterium UBA9273]
MNKQVIVCVDDETTVLRSLKTELKKAIGNDYYIEIAEGGEEALELISELLDEADEVPLVISDYIMPDMKGDELLKRIHQLSPKTVKIMLTGQADLEAVTNAINYAKLYRYIPKPWQSEDLRLTVTEAIYSYIQDKNLALKSAKLQQLNIKQAALITQLDKSERKFRAIFNQTFQFTGMLNTEGILIEANQTALDFGGLQLEDVVGKPCWECYWWTISPETQTQLQAAIAQAVQGEFIRYEVDVLGERNRTATIDFSIKPICEASGKVEYLIVEGRDISERKRVQEALIQAEQKYRSIFENALEGIFQTTADGVYISANRALAQILGYNSPEELIATLEDIEHQLYVEPHRRAEFLKLMQHYGEVSDFESRVYRRDGSIIWISESARTVCDTDGSLCYYQGFVEDITARKKAEAERERFTAELFQLNEAFSRFVPSQFLQLLDKKSIVDVRLGDQVQKEMSVLFSDIRDFTTLSESMTPQDNFKFINAYLKRMEPALLENQGFIDKYIGDGIMALFSGSADDAINAGIAMLQRLADYNQQRVKSGYKPIKIGIGINTGKLMLGTVGGKHRMDGTVISDDVNLASRLESLTKNYGVSLLISQQTLARLENPTAYSIRFIEQATVKGKSKAIAIFEVFDGDSPEIKDSKLTTKSLFEEGLFLYYQQDFWQAEKLFAAVMSSNSRDKVAQIYLERCHHQLRKFRSITSI